jgi:hypothetical protein
VFWPIPSFLKYGDEKVMTRFCILDQRPVPILLGTSFLHSNRAVRDFSTGQLTLRASNSTSFALQLREGRKKQVLALMSM